MKWGGGVRFDIALHKMGRIAMSRNHKLAENSSRVSIYHYRDLFGYTKSLERTSLSLTYTTYRPRLRK